MKKRISVLEYVLSTVLLSTGFLWVWLFLKYRDQEKAWTMLAEQMKLVSTDMTFDDMINREFPDQYWDTDGPP